MTGDNAIFRVNGETKEELRLALGLAFMLMRGPAVAWEVTQESGLILHWSNAESTAIRFPTDIDSDQATEIVWQWLQSEEAQSIRNNNDNQWENNLDHDGSNGHGWLVFTGDWGHVEGRRCAICAIRPCWLWFGK